MTKESRKSLPTQPEQKQSSRDMRFLHTIASARSETFDKNQALNFNSSSDEELRPPEEKVHNSSDTRLTKLKLLCSKSASHQNIQTKSRKTLDLANHGDLLPEACIQSGSSSRSPSLSFGSRRSGKALFRKTISSTTVRRNDSSQSLTALRDGKLSKDSERLPMGCTAFHQRAKTAHGMRQGVKFEKLNVKNYPRTMSSDNLPGQLAIGLNTSTKNTKTDEDSRKLTKPCGGIHFENLTNTGHPFTHQTETFRELGNRRHLVSSIRQDGALTKLPVMRNTRTLLNDQTEKRMVTRRHSSAPRRLENTRNKSDDDTSAENEAGDYNDVNYDLERHRRILKWLSEVHEYSAEVPDSDCILFEDEPRQTDTAIHVIHEDN